MRMSGAAVGAGETVDVLIVTAVEVEYAQALLVDTGAWPGSEWEKHPGPSGFEIAFRTFRAADGSPMRFGLTRAHGMGGVEAVNVALPALAAYQPRCLAMCGVCAGRQGDVELGDVIVADRIWAYDTGKLKAEIDAAGKRTERIQGDMWQYLLDPGWKVSAERFLPGEAELWLSTRPRSYEMQGDWVLECLVDGDDPTKHPDRQVKCKDQGKVFKQLWEKLVEDGTLTLTEAGRKHIGRLRILNSDGLPEAPAFKVHVGPIASGGRVVEDPQIFNRLSSEMRKVLGLEMEASAIGAIGHLQKIPMIVMKGVMDFADPARSDNFKEFAARASAECLIAFLRANLERGKPGFDDILETGISPQPKNPSPAQMLNARYRFVPFYEPGRTAILEQLQAWCFTTETSASALLVHGSGGIGKTRLMSEMCERLRGRGWTAGFLVKNVSVARFEELTRSRHPTLVVIDYAESRAILAPLMMAATRARAGTSEPPLRIILLARGTGDWWEELRADSQIRDLFGERPATQLMPLAAASGTRNEVFRAATRSYAMLRGRAAPAVTPALDDARFDRALYVHMAALAATEGRPLDADGLMDETLDHEERFWRVQAHPSLVADRTQHAFRTSARRATAAITLRGGELTRAGARDLLQRLDGQANEEMLSLLHDLYPGGASGASSRGHIGTLEPDLLGEAMVLRALRAEGNGVYALLDRIFQGHRDDAVEHGFVVLGRLSVNHREDTSAWIERVLTRDLAGRALAALKAAKAISKDSAHAVLGMVLASALEREGTKEIAERLEKAGIPDGTVSLREVTVWVTSVMLRDLPGTEEIAVLRERSVGWNNLGVRQGALGKLEPALVAIQEAVTIHRTLAATRPDAFLPDLAASVNNLGLIQSALGLRAPALASTREAVAIYRTLASAHPETYQPALATSLNNLGNVHRALGQHEPALASTEEAVAIHSTLAATRPDTFLPYLATSLNNLGAMQRALGQREPALASIQEAVSIRRTLAAARPDAFLPDLAISLNNLGSMQSALSQREPALPSTQEAVAIYRTLAASRPDAFLPDLATCLNNLGFMQSELGLREPALAATREAVAIRRTLAAARPDSYVPDLATSLNNLGKIQSELGQHEPALISAQEALDALWPMFLALPNAFHGPTGTILGNVDAYLKSLGKDASPELLARRRTFETLAPE